MSKNSKKVLLIIAIVLLFIASLNMILASMFTSYGIDTTIIQIGAIIGFICGMFLYFIYFKKADKEKLPEPTKFDEYQENIRNKYGLRSFIILLILILIDGFYSSFHTWAEPMANAMIIIAISLLYFVTELIRNGAYTGYNKENVSYKVSFVNFFIGLFNIAVALLSMSEQGVALYYENGIIKARSIQFVIGFMLMYASLLFVYVSKRKQKEDYSDWL